MSTTGLGRPTGRGARKSVTLIEQCTTCDFVSKLRFWLWIGLVRSDGHASRQTNNQHQDRKMPVDPATKHLIQVGLIERQGECQWAYRKLSDLAWAIIYRGNPRPNHVPRTGDTQRPDCLYAQAQLSGVVPTARSNYLARGQA